MKRWGWLFVVLALFGAIYFWQGRGSTDAGAAIAAMDRGEVDIAVSANGPSNVTILVRRLAAAPGEIGFVVPAGTVIYSRAAGVQRMVLAHAIEVALGSTEQAREYNVEAYCLDQFLDPPSTENSLSLRSSDAGIDVADGTGTYALADPAQDGKLDDLVTCLDEAGGDHADRQFAIWVTREGWLDHSPQEARSRMEERYRAKLSADAEALLRSRYRESVLSTLPNAGVEQVDRALSNYIATDLGPQVARRAATMAQRDMQGMSIPQVRALLAGCNVDLTGKPLFS